MTKVEENSVDKKDKKTSGKKIIKGLLVGGSVFFLIKGLIWAVIFFAAIFGITDLMN